MPPEPTPAPCPLPLLRLPQLWDLAVMDPATAEASKGCVGRCPQKCGVGPVCWVTGGHAHGGQPLVAVGRDDGNVEVLAWDGRKKALVASASLAEHDGPITALVSLGSTLASGAADGTVRSLLWSPSAQPPAPSAVCVSEMGPTPRTRSRAATLFLVGEITARLLPVKLPLLPPPLGLPSRCLRSLPPPPLPPPP